MKFLFCLWQSLGSQSRSSRSSRRLPSRRRFGAVAEILEDRCLLATFTVTSLLDGGSTGTLRNAIGDANNNAGFDEIVFASGLIGGTIDLTSSLPEITDSVRIAGPAPFAGSIVIDGQNIEGLRPMEVGFAAEVVTISHLTLTGGNLVGGGEEGGGLANGGNNTTLDNVHVTGNSAVRRAGGIVNFGNLTLTYSRVTHNFTEGIDGLVTGEGGGIVNRSDDSILTLHNTEVSGNTARSAGGGIQNDGIAFIYDSRIINNTAFDPRDNRDTEGGGIYNDQQSQLEIHRSEISGNTAFNGIGGGISTSFFSQSLLVSHSTISGNLADNSDGLSLSGRGGGIYVDDDSNPVEVVIRNSTIFGNRAADVGGGVYLVRGNASIINSTIAQNVALGDNLNGGAGVASVNGTMRIVHSTIVDNIALAGNDDEPGGVAVFGSGPLEVYNSVIARNLSDGSSNPDVDVADLDVNQRNWIGQLDGDPRLSALRDNGGATLTMAPLPGSPLIDAGTNAFATVTGDPGAELLLNDQRGANRVIDGNGNLIVTVDIGAVEFTPGPGKPLVTSTADGDSRVQVYDSLTGALRFELRPYPGFSGGVTVATGDVNGDGITDIITAPARGGGPHIRAFDGATGQQLLSFFAYNPLFSGGVFIASADIDQDGHDDIITGPNQGGGSHVRVFSGDDPDTVLKNLFPYSNFTGGVRVAAGDVDGDGTPDILTAPGPGGGPRVSAISGATFDVLINFFAYAPTFTGGVYVAAAERPDGAADIVAGPGQGGGPHVRLFNGEDAALISELFAYNPAFTGGVRVGAGDVDGDGRTELITAAGPGGGPHVRLFDAATGVPKSGDLSSFFPFPAGFSGGVFVASGPAKDRTIESSSLRGANVSPTIAETNTLTDSELTFTAESAIARWSDAGVSSAQLSRLNAVQFSIAELKGDLLGVSLGGRILIDADAAGFGWYVDWTPHQNEEFAPGKGGKYQAMTGKAWGRYDLLTVVLHELGHELGLSHRDSESSPDHFLADTLPPSTRRWFSPSDLDVVFSDEEGFTGA